MGIFKSLFKNNKNTNETVPSQQKVYTEKELPKNENSDQNKEAFEETGFYKIISYEKNSVEETIWI